MKLEVVHDAMAMLAPNEIDDLSEQTNQLRVLPTKFRLQVM